MWRSCSMMDQRESFRRLRKWQNLKHTANDIESFSFEVQKELQSRALTHSLISICDVNFPVFGRCTLQFTLKKFLFWISGLAFFILDLIDLQSFKKKDVLFYYHRKRVTNIKAYQYCLQPGVLCEYVLQTAGPHMRLIDASKKDCTFHKWNVCLGRSANHATQKKSEANMNMV